MIRGSVVFTVRCRRLNAGRGVLRKRIMFPLTKTQALLSLWIDMFNLELDYVSRCSLLLVHSWLYEGHLDQTRSSSLLHLLCSNSASVCFTDELHCWVIFWVFNSEFLLLRCFLTGLTVILWFYVPLYTKITFIVFIFYLKHEYK